MTNDPSELRPTGRWATTRSREPRPRDPRCHVTPATGTGGTEPERYGALGCGRLASVGWTTYVHGCRLARGKPAARRGRKARDLDAATRNGETARLPCRWHRKHGSNGVKATLARFTAAVVVLASMALTLGAGIRWEAVTNGIRW